jgi:hypothetical protein
MSARTTRPILDFMLRQRRNHIVCQASFALEDRYEKFRAADFALHLMDFVFLQDFPSIITVIGPTRRAHNADTVAHSFQSNKSSSLRRIAGPLPSATPAFIQPEPVLDTYRAVDSNAVFARN